MTSTTRPPKPKPPNLLLPWLDVFAIAAWGILLLKYWATGKLNLLIHPDYFWLVIVGGIALIIVSILRTQDLLRRNSNIITSDQHISLFPPGWGSSLLLITAIAGLVITPKVFASQTALEKSGTDAFIATRTKPASFRASSRPEERTLVEWARTLSVYPEPDKYTGQKAKVDGFVIHPPEMGKDYLFLARFIITCCAADAYDVRMPVKLKESRDQYPPDTWLEVEGRMITENISGRRQLTIDATSVKKIPQPKNPYAS
jgi:uncharacterized repeat protein (TIGR03943 family)